MSAIKIAGLLLLVFVTMSVNLPANHQYHCPGPRSFVKVFDLNTTYSLHRLGLNGWADFPSLAGDFQLEQSQLVTLSYSIQTFSTGGQYFCTRLLIDGVEDDRFRVISAAARPIQGSFHSNAITIPVNLSGGKHTIKVQFRTDVDINGRSKQYWIQSFVQAAWTEY